MNQPEDKAAAFERALASARNQKVELKLFVAGMGPRSTRAITHARRLVSLLGERCTVQVVDIYERPEAAVASQVVAVPALVRQLPKPARKLIGATADPLDTARALGLLLPAPEGGA